MTNRYKQIIELFNSGKTLREISRATGISEKIVKKLIGWGAGIRNGVQLLDWRDNIKPSGRTKQTYFRWD